MAYIQNSETDVLQLFIKKLKEYGYPDESIELVSNNRDFPGDIIIKKEHRYVQAFELKNKVTNGLFFSQYVGTYKIQIPVYCVIYTDCGFEYYRNDASSPLDECDVLNYEAAIDSFVKTVEKETSKNNQCFRLVCSILSLLFFCAALFYFFRSLCDSSYIWGTVAMSIIMLFTIMISFAKKISLDYGDLGLKFVFNQEKK